MDGLLGFARGTNLQDNQTEFLYGLVNQTKADGINNHTLFLDLGNSQIHLGDANTGSYKNQTLKGFLMFNNQKESVDHGGWAVRVEDVIYGSSENTTSLDD